MLVRDFLPALKFGAKLTASEVSGLMNRTGNVYYAVHSNHSWYQKFYDEYNRMYPDGTSAVQNSIQGAHDAATAKRGDVIIVASPSSTTGKWKENVYVTKAGLKIVGSTPAWEMQMRPGDATTQYPFTPLAGTATNGATFFLLARDVEISNFLFDGGGGSTGVYVGDGYNVAALNALGYTSQNSAGCHIHHCVFRGGSEGQYGMVLDGASANVLIEDNIFERHTVASIYLQPGGSRTVQNPIIRNNEFWAANAAYGIDLYAAASTVGTLIKGNSFRDGSSLAYTFAVRVPTGATGVTSVVGNFFACTNKMSLLATDIHCGNYAGTLNATEVFVSEA